MAAMVIACIVSASARTARVSPCAVAIAERSSPTCQAASPVSLSWSASMSWTWSAAAATDARRCATSTCRARPSVAAPADLRASSPRSPGISQTSAASRPAAA
eukprot:CAMPEP_0194272852 /NCGR_PEP_ID=MMETSP0169-20130528/6315_1 /TAXON_ID=218684 /ORGANISM="Corethron pennatum, Strain L29A3" /LENGTH=102 /DNA_ID=CAMNT_0039015623 /DNA_START=228 /DNA_END=533 /DNA_ORIENTATION=-